MLAISKAPTALFFNTKKTRLKSLSQRGSQMEQSSGNCVESNDCQPIPLMIEILHHLICPKVLGASGHVALYVLGDARFLSSTVPPI